ncbi:lysozyme inhibitor LprI family protein [Pseudomonas sp. B21-053]|uniref:lysozyme inhibitor LprI family protein n=1 Tax=Pseudomonas sp. B21-053 TaxID=2895493 RepID=UPI002232B7F8|nr:lysozyme inhibitor LprI family protein [Pseudomonas sp. B21-053]UZE09869.1 lysozyme inhibitor LprI family protein [Pseudomonas sp. B21-053]
MPLTFSPVIVTTLLLAASGVAHASSFDCTSATSPTEKAICADAYTSNLDQKLGELWSATLPKVADPKALKTDQRQWLKQRNQCSDNLSCLRQKYQMRITELGHMTTPFSWDATWQMIAWGVSTGGELKTKRKDSTHITFDVLGASGANMGNLDGIATLNGTTAHYSEGDCALTFIAMNGVLDVSQEGSDADCGAGMGVFYAGRYVASEQSLAAENDLLSVGLVRTRQEDDVLHNLLKDDYQRLVESSSSRTIGDASSDVPGAEVDEMWVRGLGGINASIFMHTTDSRFWLVLIVSDSRGNLRARYYTNVPSWKGRLPETLKRWYDKRAAAGSLPLDIMP